MIALYPIKPIYAEQILSGKKKIELRKKLPTKNIKYILIYATSPISKIIGYAEVTHMEKFNKFELWEKNSTLLGINKESYFEYYSNCTTACAISLGTAFTFIKPFPISDISPKTTVPQSFCYIAERDFSRLKKRKNKKYDL